VSHPEPNQSAVRLFVCDIDGCLAEPYQPYDLARLGALRDYAARAEADPAYPAVSLCSGRAYPYVEAMTQVLGLTAPVLFEAGGGLFDPAEAQVYWPPAFTPEVAAALDAVKAWLIAEVLPGTALMYDYGKRTQAGVIGPVEAEVYAAVPRVEAYVAEHYPDLVVYHTPVSVDVIRRGITKAEGMPWLAGRVGLPLEEIAYIGDSNGDLGALGVVGHAFAPSNAAASVRETAQYVAEGDHIAGVLECYERCVKHNRSLS
jgi:hydroxymethylpyrimidine pyrophosphatase-like HAD family hydrolase